VPAGPCGSCAVLGPIRLDADADTVAEAEFDALNPEGPERALANCAS
jgi:hypothetical protein